VTLFQVMTEPPRPNRKGRSLGVVNNGNDVRDFLTSRRARITPEDAGLPSGGNRRVLGLRREEVAVLAGVSIDYYTRLERGNLTGVSDSVLEALARALQLDEAERTYLFDLARTAKETPNANRRRTPRPRLRPGIQQLLDAMSDAPSFVRNAHLDIVAANRLGRALYSPLYTDPAKPTNLARSTFLDRSAPDLFTDWDEVANTTVALLRTEAGRNPDDKNLSNLVGELSTRSDEFRTRWSAHNVRLHDHGHKRFHHPVVGDHHLAFEAMPLPDDTGLTLTAYSAEPGSPSRDGLALLASWAATLDDSERGDEATTTRRRSST
jgi:transcriptional regulator with XRE-family HTH domain